MDADSVFVRDRRSGGVLVFASGHGELFDPKSILNAFNSIFPTIPRLSSTACVHRFVARLITFHYIFDSTLVYRRLHCMFFQIPPAFAFDSARGLVLQSESVGPRHNFFANPSYCQHNNMDVDARIADAAANRVFLDSIVSQGDFSQRQDQVKYTFVT